MGDTFEAIISSEALLNALQNKSNELPDRLNQTGNDIGFIVQNNVMDEAPVITHNLQAATRLDSAGFLSWIVYPDEGVAPYALFVILGHMTRPRTIKTGGMYGDVTYTGNQHFVEGNPYLDRGLANAQSEIDDEIANFEAWCNNLES